MGHLIVTVGHPRVTICRIVGHLRVTMATVVHIGAMLGHLRVFFSMSKPKANATELHPKVRQTCLC